MVLLQRDICPLRFMGPPTFVELEWLFRFLPVLEAVIAPVLYLKRTNRSEAFSNCFNHKLTSQYFASPSEEILLYLAVLTACLGVE